MSGVVPVRGVEHEAKADRGALERQLVEMRQPERTSALLSGVAPSSSYADQGSARAAAEMRALVECLLGEEADRDAIFEHVRALCGLGPGLTPTGDDMLMALVAAGRWLADDELLSDAAVERLVSAIAEIPVERTTAVAYRLLGEACAGRYPAPLARFVEVLGDRTVSSEDLDERVSELTAIGAHSGCDWLTAVFALARACCFRAGGFPNPVPCPLSPVSLEQASD